MIQTPAALDPTQLLSLNCFLLGDEPDRMFTVEIPKNKNVSILKDLIKEKKASRLDHIDASDLDLWQVSFPIDDLPSKNPPTVEPKLTSEKLLFDVFPSDLDTNRIHVVARVPRQKVPSASLASLLRERQRFSTELPTTAPSSLGIPSEFSKFQEKQNQKIVWSRPRAADATIPVTLLHRIFRQFVDNCKNHQPIEEDNQLVLELMITMSDFFPDEKARARRLREILTSHGIPVVTSTIASKGHEFPTDGAVEIDGNLAAIVEVKGEIGSKGAEPYAQVILYYSHSNAAKSQQFPQFNFPSLLITVFGQTLLSPLSI